MDSEKVIKGLEYCEYPSKAKCDNCPYRNHGCTSSLAIDALALLKEQDERIKELELETRPETPMMVQDYPDQFGNRRTMYICGACKRSIVDGARFCIECGRKVRL